MNWKKKTQQECDEAESRKDYTCGYEFLPWLWWMRRMYLLGFFGNLALGWFGGITSFNPNNENPDWMGYSIIGFFGVSVPVLIGYLLRRDYKNLQKGISI